MRKFSRLINNFIIDIFLMVVYFFVVGLSFLIFKLFKKSKHRNSADSYWENMAKDNLDKKYFKSAY